MIVTLALSLVAVLRALVRPGRELLRTPADYWPAAAFLALAGVAWARQLRDRDSTRDTAVEVIGALAGVAALLWFFHAGQFPWQQEQDWVRNWRYFSSLQDAVIRHEVPYDLRTSLFGSDRFWANPETLIAPHLLLLGAMSISSFFMLHMLLCFAAGFIGLIALKRELSLSPLPWVVFVILFLMNGHIMAHLSVGHLQWVSYFLLPWVLLCLTRAAAGDRSVRNAAALALTLAAMLMNGGWHVFVWSLLLTVFFCLTSTSRLVFMARTLVLAALLAAFRLLPTMLTYRGATNVFALSFRTVPMLFDALANGQTARFAHETEGWWEFDTYVGWVGFAIMCLGAASARARTTRFLNTFYLPVVVLFALSLGDVYQSTLFHVPGFVSERVVTRIAIVPTLVLLLIGCVRLDRWMRKGAGRLGVASAALFLASCFLVAQVVLNAAAWRPAAGAVPPATASLLKTGATVERLYVGSVWGGCAISIATLAALVLVVFAPTAFRPRQARQAHMER